MTIEELQARIKKFEDRRRGALPPSIEHQVVAMDEHTRALMEISLQVALGALLVQESILGLTRQLNASLGAAQAELALLRKTVDQFGMAPIQLPPSSEFPSSEFVDGGGI